MMKRRFARRPTRAARQWSDVASQFAVSGATGTTAVILVQLQSPTSLAALTSDPPEDLTVLRMVGTFQMFLAGATSGSWTLGLTVADVTWTPGATFGTDADKRILWHRTYRIPANTATSASWSEPGYMNTDGGNNFPCHPDLVSVDISPKVRVEPGKALYLVAWENSGTLTASVASADMRILYQRSGRR